MNWQDIVFELLDDEMIQSCGCDGLHDGYNLLKGLFAMSELMYNSDKFNDEFILEAINSSIKARNRYCSLNGAKKLEYVKIEDGEFVWESECYGGC